MTSPSQKMHAEINKKVGKDAEPVAQGHAAQNAAEVASVAATDPTYGTDMKLVGVEDEVGSDLYDESSREVYVTLKEPVLEQFFFENTHTPSYRVLYHKGQTVPLSVVEAYNEATKAANAARKAPGGLDPENPASIDSSTRHGGTFPGVVGEAKKVAEAKIQGKA